MHQRVIDDPRYWNTCIEHTDYQPVNIEEPRVR
jgi:hypothetical protein